MCQFASWLCAAGPRVPYVGKRRKRSPSARSERRRVARGVWRGPEASSGSPTAACGLKARKSAGRSGELAVLRQMATQTTSHPQHCQTPRGRRVERLRRHKPSHSPPGAITRLAVAGEPDRRHHRGSGTHVLLLEKMPVARLEGKFLTPAGYLAPYFKC